MKLSCLPVSFFHDLLDGRMTVPAWARMAAELGLDAIDLSIAWLPDRSPAALAALRREIEATGMSLAMLTSYPDFTHPDPARRAQELLLARDVVRVAAASGARFVRATAGQAHPKTPRQLGIDWAVQGLTQLVESTRGSGVSIVYENHAKPFVWPYSDFSQPPEIFLEIVDRTANVGLDVNFDTGNATAFAEDPVALLDRVIDRVRTVHAADTAVRGALQMVLLGTGLTPFPALFKRLKQFGFDGWICMEEGSGQGREGVASAARYIRQVWMEA